MWTRPSWTGSVARLTIAAVLVLSLVPLRAGTVADSASDLAVSETRETEPFPARAAVRALIEKETARAKLPADIAEAVVFVESRYDSTVIGRVGEIGLMQVKPETAAMLGFRGTTEELAKPEINIHYGVTYLAKAWRLAQGDLCRALMKYRAGHGEETMTPRSTIYCNRARNRLIAMNSPFAAAGASAVATDPVELESKPMSSARPAKSQAPKPPARPTDVYAIYKRGTPAASRAFWTAHEARIRAVKARLEAKWRRVASR
ncbi:lytic transglycosylase domain-containing protein [Bradyrhizobium liaoningense]|uniref:lytic transglycosylase domain-containing protein n=1 Tax=Bradyrhizobium liaoningense TaxID=43992 RepID=UPI001BAA56B2|nr:transglycosylase SLT domain-containing protein [Bradyrhizobium liaoningense]MBR0719740.1 transglycosylase SLT domain-containing protein [Bradyrhizobium liaoningense]